MVLSEETLQSVTDAVLDAGLDLETLLSTLPSEVRRELPPPSGRTPKQHYLLVFTVLRALEAPRRDQHPLRAVLHRAQYLSGVRRETDVFRKAIAEIDGAPLPLVLEGELYTKRAKEYFVAKGYEVFPPLDAPASRTFRASRKTDAILVIGIATGPLERVIATVLAEVHQHRRLEPRTEGHVVLMSQGDALATEDAEVRKVGLVPMSYLELSPFDRRELDVFVSRQLKAREPRTAPFGSSEASLDGEFDASILRDRNTRVLLLQTCDAQRDLLRIVRVCTDAYRTNPNRAAPLVLELGRPPYPPLVDLVCQVFRDREVPFSRFDLPRLLEEGMFLPIFDPTAQAVSFVEVINVVAQALLGRTKVVILLPLQVQVPHVDVARALNLSVLGVRVLSAVGPTSGIHHEQPISSARVVPGGIQAAKSSPFQNSAYLGLRLEVRGARSRARSSVPPAHFPIPWETRTSAGDPQEMRILFLAANPLTTVPLDLEGEIRTIENELRAVKHRARIKFIPKGAVEPDDVVRYLRDEKPTVVHFSGHGAGKGLVLRNHAGGHSLVSSSVLARVFRDRGVELVVLNACYSKEQADAIATVVRVAIGTSDAVAESAAHRFAKAFYRTLGNGHSVADAFRDGGDTVAISGGSDVFHVHGDDTYRPFENG